MSPRAPLRISACVFTLACLMMGSDEASAFPYTAQRGDTLAEIAEKFYGRVEMEKVLVAANGFDDEVPLLPGMRVEVPAVSYYRVTKGETWNGLADRLLGDAKRGEALALSNDTMPWLPPLAGREIVVPYPLRYVVHGGDNVLSIAYRFLGDRDAAYVVDRFNHLKGEPLEPGDVVIVPITDLVLTDEGREAARRSQRLVLGEGAGEDRDAQDRAEREMPLLDGEVRSGKYLEAVMRGSQLLGGGRLTDVQLGRVNMRMVEALVALDHNDLASGACAEWRRYDPDTVLDPIELSPKILKACTTAPIAPGMGAIGIEPPADAGAATPASPVHREQRPGSP